MLKFKEYVNESKSDYVIYHDTYTSAVQAAQEFAVKQGYEIDDDEVFNKIGTGPAKPGNGKTNRLTLELMKGGKEVKNRALHIQVYNTGTKYELNTYIS